MGYAYKGFCHETDAIALQKFVFDVYPYIENGKTINYQSAANTVSGAFNVVVQVSENGASVTRNDFVSFLECAPFPDDELIQALGVSFSVGFILVAVIGVASIKIGLILKQIRR